MRDKIYYDGELAEYNDITDINNLYYTSKPVDVDDVSLDSEYDYRRLPKFIQEDIDYAESANDLISKGKFLDADDEEFTFNDIMKYEYKGDTYIIRGEGYSYPRYVVKITNVGESFAKGGAIPYEKLAHLTDTKRRFTQKEIEKTGLEETSAFRKRNLDRSLSADIGFTDPKGYGVIYEFQEMQRGKDKGKFKFHDMQVPRTPYYSKGGDIKTMNMIDLESIGTMIDPRTGMTYAMMADGKSYDPDTETHITEIDMSEYDYQITEKDREILLDILQNPETDEFAKGGMTGGFNPSGNVPIIKAKYYGMSDFGELIFKGDNGRFYVVVDGKTHSTTDDMEPMFPVLNVKLLDIPKDTGVSFARGGRLNSVLVKFKDPQYNYVTSIGANVSEAEAKNYFIGMPVNVASYPSEKFVEVIDIEYNPKSKDMEEFEKGGEVANKGRYIVSIDGRATTFRGDDLDEAYEKFIDTRSEVLYKSDVMLIDTDDDETIEYYDSQEDREQEEEFGNYAKGGKISKDEAIVKAMRMGVDFNKQFHAQSYGNELAELARETGYRKSKSSSGSLGRAFFEHLEKRYDKSPEYYDNLSTNDMFAKGGLLEHGLKSGDTIMFPLSDNRVEVKDLFGQSKQVDLETGERTEMRYAKGGYVVSFEYSNGEVENIEFDNLNKAQKFYNESVENNDGEELISLLQGNREIESFSPTSDQYDRDMYDEFAKGGMTGKKTYLLANYFVDVYEDSYEQGELDMVHSWSSRDMQDANKEFPNKEALLNYLKDILESHIMGQYEIKDNSFDINDMGDGKVRIKTSVLAKYDDRGYGEYIYPTQDEKDMWKKGEQKLFSVYYTFYVEVYKKTNSSF